MAVTASRLRENVYQLLDEVVATGRPLEVERKGKLLRIVPVETRSKLSRLKKHDLIIGDPEELIHMDWSSEWNPEPM
jgi:prevent-host-death family protein